MVRSHRRRRGGELVARVLLLTGLASFCEGQAPRFVEMVDISGIDHVTVSGAPEKRYILSSLGGGACLFDYDEDGDLDLYLTNGAELEDRKWIEAGPNRLYRNQGSWNFEDVTEQAGVGDRGWSIGCAVGDIDNDGLPDLYVTNIGANLLYRNRGDGTFADVAAEAGVGHPSFGSSSAFFDAEGDGDLDLYVVNYLDPDIDKLPPPGAELTCLWLGLDVMCGPRGLEGASDVYFVNEGDGTFKEATHEAGFFDPAASYGLGVVTADYDDDGDMDVFVSNDTQPNFLFNNDGKGHFTEVGFLSGASYNAEGGTEAGMGVDFGDPDGNGRLDLFVTSFSNETNTLYSNVGDGFFTDATNEAGLAAPSLGRVGWAARWVDLDHDGDQDLFVSNGHLFPRVAESDTTMSYRQLNQIYLNQGNGQFVEATVEPGDALEQNASSRGGAFGDIDNDGDIDAVIVNLDERPSLLRNEGPTLGKGFHLRLIGKQSNRDAIGARVILQAGPSKQVREVHASGSILSSSDFRLHFGLGESDTVDTIEIRWPSGQVQTLGPSSEPYLLVVEK